MTKNFNIFSGTQNLNSLPEEDSTLMSSICQTISNVSVDQVEDPELNFDFGGLRLDWARLQSYVSSAQVGKPGLLLDNFKVNLASKQVFGPF